MMRPMKLAGSQLLFGQGCLDHLKTLPYRRAFIVVGGSSMDKSGMLDKVVRYLTEAGMDTAVFRGVEPDPSFQTVYAGAGEMNAFEPDLIVALGGGSAMDAAKAMWIYYEHPELSKLSDITAPNPIPPLRKKAVLACIPSTAGTASEVSRSIVITDEKTHLKYGIGNMELMPDIAICDPEVTCSMPPRITAETGMDALTHALEAMVSGRANYVSDVLVHRAARDIFSYLPLACAQGENLEYREKMLNASMIAGMAFTNVSLGIVHSMAHTLGSVFGLAHGLADAILLPYIMRFNEKDATAREKYGELAQSMGQGSLIDMVQKLNEKIGIPRKLADKITDRQAFEARLAEMAQMALADGCTKTNPIIPTVQQLEELFMQAYNGGDSK